MIRIIVFPTSTDRAETERTPEEQRGVPVDDFDEFLAEAKAMKEYGEVKITVHGKDLRATCIQTPPSRRGIGNNQ